MPASYVNRRPTLCTTKATPNGCSGLRFELETRFPTLHLVGRNGMHRYNNQDHAMMTALLTSANILAGSRVFDVWQVNEDAGVSRVRAGGRQ